jgi:hypothetical protein
MLLQIIYRDFAYLVTLPNIFNLDLKLKVVIVKLDLPYKGKIAHKFVEMGLR